MELVSATMRIFGYVWRKSMTESWTFARGFSVALAVGVLLATTACSVQVDPSRNGEGQNVRIQTPAGAVQVKTDGMVAADIGLPAYPGATVMGRNEKDNAADIHVGFGDWQMHLKVVKYHTPDSQEQVLAFYRKALGRYGDVIQCDGDRPVGTPVVTHQGLGCKSEEGSHEFHSNIKAGHGSAQLKAGSQRHQHLMGIDSSGGNGTDFSLLALDLPPGDASPSKDKPRETN